MNKGNHVFSGHFMGIASWRDGSKSGKVLAMGRNGLKASFAGSLGRFVNNYSGCQKYVPFRTGYRALAGDISF